LPKVVIYKQILTNKLAMGRQLLTSPKHTFVHILDTEIRRRPSEFLAITFIVSTCCKQF